MSLRVLAAAVLLVALAGCAPTPASPASPDSPDSPTSPTVTSPPEPTASAACTQDDLSIWYEEADASAGHRHAILTFVNRSDAPCSIEGYPVVFMGSSDAAGPAGLPAGEDPTAAVMPSTLQPGGKANTVLNITQAGMVEGCTVVKTTHLTVAPPLDHAFVWEDDGRDVPTPELLSCVEQDVGLLTVWALAPFE